LTANWISRLSPRVLVIVPNVFKFDTLAAGKP
jgi:hypothetical protein